MVLEQTCHGCLQWDLWGLKLPRFDIWWKIHLAIAQPLKWIQGIYHFECFLFRGWNNADIAKTFQHPKLKVLWRIGIHQSWNLISKNTHPSKKATKLTPTRIALTMCGFFGYCYIPAALAIWNSSPPKDPAKLLLEWRPWFWGAKTAGARARNSGACYEVQITIRIEIKRRRKRRMGKRNRIIIWIRMNKDR